MKKLAILALLGLNLAVSGCGSKTLNTTLTNTTASGNWEAHVNGGLGETSKLDFVTAFSVTDNGSGTNLSLDITGFNFFNAGSCFTNTLVDNSEAGVTTFSTITGTDQVIGKMTYKIGSNVPPGSVLTLTSYANGFTGTSTATQNTTGTLSNGVVVGTWMLQNNSSNPDCTGSGTFIMCQAAATCTAP
ncbi:MAG TPA: hypothetical protein VKF84_00730 [Candidatus Sulfotelmatobacter sp.]|nr:hypothetical protein [Candidatus Sulfotelmatobacter sp.]